MTRLSALVKLLLCEIFAQCHDPGGREETRILTRRIERVEVALRNERAFRASDTFWVRR